MAESASRSTTEKEPHQPKDFSFPKREFGTSTIVRRSFQPSWFDRWPWLHYCEDKDAVLCFTCMRARTENKLKWSLNAESAFITTGFTNWKKASDKFTSHEASKCHKEAVLRMETLPATTRNIGECLSKEHQREKLDRRQCFLKILSNLKFLARQGLPIRGHGSEIDSNFIQLLKLRGEDDHRIEGWLKKRTDKYTSADIQNEILKLMAHRVMREVVSVVRSAPFMTLMMDETTDASNSEQVVICLRWVDGNLEAHEEFIGLYKVASTESSSLFAVVQDVLTRLNISIHHLRGQCYDGASSMSGSRSGVAKLVLDREPKAVYTHCYGHALNLACSDSVKGCELMRNALDIVYEITKLIKKSPRRDSTFQNLKQEISPALCPTRWTVRADALHSIISNYSVLQALWVESLEFVKEAEMRSRIIGVSTTMKSFNFFFGVSLGELILRHSDNLSRTLQSSHVSAAEGQRIAAMSVKTLQLMRTEENFKMFWSNVTSKSRDFDIGDPVLPRKRKVPRRYDMGTGEGDHPERVEDFYRVIYFEALDLITNSIQNRFDQPGYQTYSKLENLLIKAANKQDYTEELDFVTSFYTEDLSKEQLKVQLDVMTANLPHEADGYDFPAVLNQLKAMSSAQRSLICQVCTLTSLILVMPATNAVSERSFSTLRRTKMYLRSTMSQVRLNNVMTLHIHKDLVDQLNLVDIGNDFISASEHRQHSLGTFLHSD